MKKTTSNFLVKAFLVFIIGAFILFGISNFLIGMGRYNMIKIGNRKISIVKFSKILSQNRNALYNNNLSQDDLAYINSPQFKYEILNRQIREELLNNEIYSLKINMTDKDVAKIIAQNENFLDEKGKFDNAIFQAFLNNARLTEKEYIESFGEYYSRNVLVDSLIENPLLMDSIIDKITKYKNQIRQSNIIDINLSSLPVKVKTPTPEELKKYYEEYKETFTIPETRKISYVELNINDYTQNISINNKDIRAEYNNNKNAYRVEESKDFYYLATKNRNLAKIMKKELDKGEDVLQIAKQYLNKEKEYIYITDIKKGMIDRKIEKQIENLKENEYSDIINNNGFYAIFYIVKIHPEKQLPFEQVKSSIKKDLFNNQKEEIALNTVKKLEDELLTVENLKEIAKDFRLKINNLGYLNYDKLKSLNLGDEKEIDSLFEYKKGDLSNLILADENKYRVFFIEDIREEKTQTFEEVKNKIKTQIINDKKLELAEAKIPEIEKELRKSKNISTTAKKYNLKINWNVEIKKDNQKYSQTFIDNLYSLKKIGDTSKVSREGKNLYKISILRSIRNLKDGDKDYISRTDVINELNTSLQNSLLANYFEKYLKDKYSVAINAKMLEQVD